MRKRNHAIYKLITSEDAATSVEYAVMLMLIAGAILSVVELVGFRVSDFWSNNASDIDNSINTGP